MVKVSTTADDINVVAHLWPLRSKSFAPTQARVVTLRSTRTHWAVGRGEIIDEALPVWIHPDNDVTGGIHAFITLDDNNVFWIRDNLSKNGTTVNGKMIPRGGKARLDDQAKVWLGPEAMRHTGGFLFDNTLARNLFLQKYKYDQKLGGGQFGDVFRFYSRRNFNHVFAVKVIRYDDNKDPYARYGHREVDVMKELDVLKRVHEHVHICKLVDDFNVTDSRMLYVVMEFMSLDLRRFFAGQRADLSTVQTVLKQLLLAAQHLRSLGFIHRDIKGENILVANGDRKSFLVRVADFGLACNVKAVHSLKASYLRAGSAWFMAPELVVNEGEDLKDPFAVDIFSIGITAFTMLRGQECDPWNRRWKDFTTDEDEVEWFRERRLTWAQLDVHIPTTGISMLHGLVKAIPSQRWTAEQALNWSWMTEITLNRTEPSRSTRRLLKVEATRPLLFPSATDVQATARLRPSIYPSLPNPRDATIPRLRPRVQEKGAIDLSQQMERLRVDMKVQTGRNIRKERGKKDAAQRAHAQVQQVRKGQGGKSQRSRE